MAIYRAAPWILTNGVSFTRVSIFSNSLATIKSLSGFVKNCTIVRECRHCLNLLSGRFTSVSLQWAPGHSDIPESSAIVLGMPVASVKLESCSIAKITWLLMDKRRTTTNYLVLVVTSYQPQWPCLQVIALWENTRRKWSFHSTTSSAEEE